MPRDQTPRTPATRKIAAAADAVETAANVDDVITEIRTDLTLIGKAFSIPLTTSSAAEAGSTYSVSFCKPLSGALAATKSLVTNATHFIQPPKGDTMPSLFEGSMDDAMAMQAYLPDRPRVHDSLPYAMFRKFDPNQSQIPIRRRARPKVLVADGNLIHLIACKLVFDKYFEVVDVCTDGKQVLELLQVNVYDIIFLAAEMDELDGPETAETIRFVEDAAGSEFKCFVVGLLTKSQSMDEPLMDRCFISGMDRFVLRPLLHHVHLVQSTISSVSVSEGFRRAILEKQWFSNRGHLLAILRGTKEDAERSARIAALANEPELLSEAAVTTLIDQQDDRVQVESLLARQRHEELQRMNATILQMQDTISDLSYEVSVLEAENKALRETQTTDQLLELQKRVDDLEMEVSKAKLDANQAAEKVKQRELEIRQLLDSGCKNEAHVQAAVKHALKHRVALERQEATLMSVLDVNSSHSWYNYYGSIEVRSVQPLTRVPEFATDVTASWFRPQLSKLMVGVRRYCTEVLSQTYVTRNDLNRRANAIIQQNASRNKLSNITSMFSGGGGGNAPTGGSTSLNNNSGSGAGAMTGVSTSASAGKDELLLSQIVVSSMTLLAKDGDEIITKLINEVESSVANLLVREHFLFEAIEMDDPKTIRSEIGMIREFINEQRRKRLANSVNSQTEAFLIDADVISRAAMEERIALGADVFDTRLVYGQKGKTTFASPEQSASTAKKQLGSPTTTTAVATIASPVALTNPTPLKGFLIDTIPATGRLVTTFTTKGHLRKKWAKVRRALDGKKLLSAQRLPTGVIDEEELELLADLERAAREEEAKKAYSETSAYYGLNDPNDALLKETKSFAASAFLPGAGGISKDGKVKSKLLSNGVLIDEEDLSSDTCSESFVQSEDEEHTSGLENSSNPPQSEHLARSGSSGMGSDDAHSKKDKSTKKKEGRQRSDSLVGGDDTTTSSSCSSCSDSPDESPDVSAKKEADRWKEDKNQRKQRRAALRAAKAQRHQRRVAILPHSHILKVLTTSLLPVSQSEKYVHQKERMRSFLSCYDTIAKSERKSKHNLADGIVKLFAEAKAALEMVDELSLPVEGLVEAYNKKLMLDHIAQEHQIKSSLQTVVSKGKKEGKAARNARRLQQLAQLQEAVADGTVAVDSVETVEEVEERLNSLTSGMPKSLPVGGGKGKSGGKSKSKKPAGLAPIGYYAAANAGQPPSESEGFEQQAAVILSSDDGSAVPTSPTGHPETKGEDNNVSFSGASLLSASQNNTTAAPISNTRSGRLKRKGAPAGGGADAKAKEALLDEASAFDSLAMISSNIVPIMKKCVEKANLLSSILAANAELIAEQQAALAAAATAVPSTTFLTDVGGLTSPITPKNKAPTPKASSQKAPPPALPARPNAAQVTEKQMQNVHKERRLFEDRLHFLLDGDAEIGTLFADAEDTGTGDGDHLQDGGGGGVASLLAQLFASADVDEEGTAEDGAGAGERRKRAGAPLPTTNADLVEKVADAVDQEIAAHADDVHEYAANKALTALLRAAVVAKKKKTGGPNSLEPSSLTSDQSAANATLANNERPSVALSMRELVALHTRLAIQNAPDAAAAVAANAAPQWISLATISHMFQIPPEEIKVHFKEVKEPANITPSTTTSAPTIPTLSLTEPSTKPDITALPYDNNLHQLLSTSEDIIFHIPVSFAMLDGLMKKTAVQRKQRKHAGLSNSNSRSASLVPSQNGSFNNKESAMAVGKRLRPGSWSAQKSPASGGTGALYPTLSFGAGSSQSQGSAQAQPLADEGSVTDTLMEQLTDALIKISNKQQRARNPPKSLSTRKTSSSNGGGPLSLGAPGQEHGKATLVFEGQQGDRSISRGGAPSPLDAFSVAAAASGLIDPNVVISTDMFASNSGSHSARSSPTAASLSPHHHRLLHAVLATQHDIVSTFAKEDKIREKQDRLDALKAAPTNTVLDLDGVFKGSRMAAATTTEAAVPTISKAGGRTPRGGAAALTPSSGPLATPGGAAVPSNMKRLYFKQQLTDGTYELLDIIVPSLTDTEAQQSAKGDKKSVKGAAKGATTSSSSNAQAANATGGQSKASVTSRRVCKDRGTCTADDNTWAAGGVPLGNAAGYEAFDLVTKAQRQRRRVLIGQRFGTEVHKFASAWQSKRTALLKEFVEACKGRQSAILDGRGRMARSNSGEEVRRTNFVDDGGEDLGAFVPTGADLKRALQLALAQQQAESELRGLTVPIPKDMARAFLTAPTVHTYQIGECCEELLSAFGAVSSAESAVTAAAAADASSQQSVMQNLSPHNISTESAATSITNANSSATGGVATQSGFDASHFPKAPMEMLSGMLLMPPSSGNTAVLPSNTNVSSLHTTSINFGNPLEVQKLPLGAMVMTEGLHNDEGVAFMVSAADKKKAKEEKKKARQLAVTAAAVAAAMAIKNAGGNSDAADLERAKATAAEEHLNALLAQARADPHNAGLTGVNLVANSHQTIILPHQAQGGPHRAFPILQGQDLTLSVPLLPLLTTINACANNPRTALAAITGQRYPSQHLPYPTSSDVDELLVAAAKLWKWLCALGQLALEPPTMPLTAFQSKQVHMAVAAATVEGLRRGAADGGSDSSSDSGFEDASAAEAQQGKGWYYAAQGVRPGTPNVSTTTAAGKPKMVPSYEHVVIPPQAMIIHELTQAELKQFSMAGTVTANTTLSTLTVKKNLPLYLASLYPGASPSSIIYYNTQGRNPFHSYQDVMEVVGVGGPSTPPPTTTRRGSNAGSPKAAAKGSAGAATLPPLPTAALLSPYYTSDAFLEVQRARAEAKFASLRKDGVPASTASPKHFTDGSTDLINSVFMTSHHMSVPHQPTSEPLQPLAAQPVPQPPSRGGKKATAQQAAPPVAAPPLPTDPCFTETTGIYIRIPIQDREHFMARVLWQADVVRARHERLLLQCVQEKRGLHPEAAQWISKAVRIALGHTRSVVTCFTRAQKLFYHDSGYGGLLGGIGYSYYYHPATAKGQQSKSARIERRLAQAPKKMLKRYLKRKKERRLLNGPYDLGGAYLSLDASDLEENGYEDGDQWDLSSDDSSSDGDGSNGEGAYDAELALLERNKSNKRSKRLPSSPRRRASSIAEASSSTSRRNTSLLPTNKRASQIGTIPSREDMVAARLAQDSNRKEMPPEWEQRSKDSVQIHMRRLQAQQAAAAKMIPRGPKGVLAGASTSSAEPLPVFSNSAGQQQQFMPIYTSSLTSQPQQQQQPRRSQATGQLRPIGKLKGMASPLSMGNRQQPEADPNFDVQRSSVANSAAAADERARLSPPKRAPIVLSNPFKSPPPPPIPSAVSQPFDTAIISLLNHRSSVGSVAPFMYDADATNTNTPVLSAAAAVVQIARARAESLLLPSRMRASIVGRSSSTVTTEDDLAVSGNNRRRSEAGLRSEDSATREDLSPNAAARKYRSASHQLMADLRPVGAFPTGGEDLHVEGNNLSTSAHPGLPIPARARGASLAKFVGVYDGDHQPQQQPATLLPRPSQSLSTADAPAPQYRHQTIVTSSRAPVRATNESDPIRHFELVGSNYSPVSVASTGASPTHPQRGGGGGRSTNLGSSPPTFGGGMSGHSGLLTLEGKGTKTRAEVGQLVHGRAQLAPTAGGSTTWDSAASGGNGGYTLGRAEAGSQVVMLSGMSFGAPRVSSAKAKDEPLNLTPPTTGRTGRRAMFGKPNMPSLNDPSAFSLLKAAGVSAAQKPKTPEVEGATSINAKNKAHFNKMPPKKQLALQIATEEKEKEAPPPEATPLQSPAEQTLVVPPTTAGGNISPQQVHFMPPESAENGAFGNMRPATVRHDSPPASPTKTPIPQVAVNFPIAYNDLPVMLKAGKGAKNSHEPVVDTQTMPDIASGLLTSPLPSSDGIRIGKPTAFGAAVADSRKTLASPSSKASLVEPTPSLANTKQQSPRQAPLVTQPFGPSILSSKAPMPPLSPKPPSPPPTINRGGTTTATPTPVASPSTVSLGAQSPQGDGEIDLVATNRPPPPMSLNGTPAPQSPLSTGLATSPAPLTSRVNSSEGPTRQKPEQAGPAKALSARGLRAGERRAGTDAAPPPLAPLANAFEETPRRTSTNSTSLPRIPSTPTNAAASRQPLARPAAGTTSSVPSLPSIGNWTNTSTSRGGGDVTEVTPALAMSATTDTLRALLPVAPNDAEAASAPASITAHPRSPAARLTQQQGSLSSTASSSGRPLGGTATTSRQQAFIRHANNDYEGRASSGFSDVVARSRAYNLEGAETAISAAASLSLGSMPANTQPNSMGGITIETSMATSAATSLLGGGEGSVRLVRPSAIGSGTGIVSPSGLTTNVPPSMTLSGAAFVQSMSHIVNPLIAEPSQAPQRSDPSQSTNPTTFSPAGSLSVTNWASASGPGNNNNNSQSASLAPPANPSLVRRSSNVQTQPIPPSLAFHRDKK